MRVAKTFFFLLVVVSIGFFDWLCWFNWFRRCQLCSHRLWYQNFITLLLRLFYVWRKSFGRGLLLLRLLLHLRRWRLHLLAKRTYWLLYGLHRLTSVLKRFGEGVKMLYVLVVVVDFAVSIAVAELTITHRYEIIRPVFKLFVLG